MEYKFVSISDSVQVPVPTGLTSDEEAKYIADKIAYVDFVRLEDECVELVKQWEDGKLISFDNLLNELEHEDADGSNT